MVSASLKLAVDELERVHHLRHEPVRLGHVRHGHGPRDAAQGPAHAVLVAPVADLALAQGGDRGVLVVEVLLEGRWFGEPSSITTLLAPLVAAAV